ncbi:unnamed protein product, partial [marine sediment metagenome]
EFSQVFKINSKEASMLVEEHVWTILYSITNKFKNPSDLKEKLEPIIQIDTGKTKEHIWNILAFSTGDNRNKNSFKEIYGPIFKINTREAYKLVEDKVWTILYSLAREAGDPEELREKLEPIVQIDVKLAAEMIKEDNPEKHKLLLLYK